MARVQQAGAVVVRERDGVTEALVVQSRKNPSHWVFPKGHVEAGESTAETAVRELCEEAGVVGSIVCGLGVSRFQMGSKDIEVTYFLMRFAGEAPPSEVRDKKWLPLPDARRLVTFDDARGLLDEAARVLALGGG